MGSKTLNMKKEPRSLLLLPEFQKFINASATGRRLLPSGKRITKGTTEQYRCVHSLLEEFEKRQPEHLRIVILHRSSLQLLQREKNYWLRFFRKFSAFLYV